MSFDRATVELDALQRAVYAVADLMTIDITATGTRYACTLYPRQAGADTDSLAHRLRMEVNDQTLRLRIGRQTDPIRDLIFALAFSQTGLTEQVPDTAGGQASDRVTAHTVASDEMTAQ